MTEPLTPEQARAAAASLAACGGAYAYVAACVIADHTPGPNGCPHPDGHRTDSTGTLCTACYWATEMRISGYAALCRALRLFGAPSIRAVQYGDRVQETREQRLPINDAAIGLADDVFAAGVDVVLATAERIYIPRPFYLRGIEHAPPYRREHDNIARSVEAWLDRNLWLIVALPDAWTLLDPLVDALTRGRRMVEPSPPRRPTIRGACSECLSTRVTIEIRERGVFYSRCGACGKHGQIPASMVEAVLRGDSDRGGTDDGPNPHDAVEVPIER